MAVAGIKKDTAGEKNPSQIIDKQCFLPICHKWFNELQLDSIKIPLTNKKECALLLFIIKFSVVPELERDFGCRELLFDLVFS